MTDTLWDALYDSKAMDFLDLAGANNILDLGCGSGMWTWTLRRLQNRARIVGLDSDASALTQAKKNLGARAELVRADASFLPFKEGCFGFVTCRRLLINLGPRKRGKVIAEMMRVAKTGGLVTSVEPSLQANKANHFSTVRGSLRFSKRLEKAVAGTDFTLGPRVAYYFVRAGLQKVDVWAYLLVTAHLPPRYHDLFLSTVVHGGGFVHALSTVRPPFRGRKGKMLLCEAERLDREVSRQRDRKALVSVTAIPVFITKGTKLLPK
jgi:ubiquinone/menaquinone biosynthesis C-methylase UbiE